MGLCVAACRQRRRVRFTTATALINELVEAIGHVNRFALSSKATASELKAVVACQWDNAPPPALWAR